MAAMYVVMLSLWWWAATDRYMRLPMWWAITLSIFAMGGLASFVLGAWMSL